ncbi:formamidopyrimidine-DNA glycosylase [Nitzschia inconspicua]|uniref:Formamidopyrimidine-DNA glycosylase n=1 Tax=Nitzschia inconspicua TaxID=303405 RepID=A0A9K3KUR8_9STRA|nr:formamidopyrimidine-DNA glycosylase [Nitzschia inconspicua]
MPELPEVEQFRSLLAPLISNEHVLTLERHSLEKAPPRKFLSDEDIADIHLSKLVVSEVLRKGKLICMVLSSKNAPRKKKKYLLVHMGMTGRISNASRIPKLMELAETTEYPPPHTYLKFIAGPYDACFSDPRKFGSVLLKDSMDDDFDVLAPDAWTEIVTKTKPGEMLVDPTTIAKLSEQKLGIKALLLDQNRAVSGVGNYLADEILYQLEMHPDQKYLTSQQAETVLRKLFDILNVAIDCYAKEEDFPKEWLFHYRWGKGKKEGPKDCHGRTITFLTSGGRTSAIVPSIQKLKAQKTTSMNSGTQVITKNPTTSTTSKTKTEVESTTKIRVPQRPIARKRKAGGSSSTNPSDEQHKKGSRRSPRLAS